MRKVAGIGAVTLAAAAMVVVQGTAAQAAAPKCWTGSWKVSAASFSSSGPDVKLTAKGGAGIKVKLSKAGVATYNFAGSKPLSGKGSYKGVPGTFKIQLAKSLKMGNKITGSKKGVVTAKRKTAAGTATIKITVPVVYTYGPKNIAKLAKSGGDLGAIPIKAGYTCKGKSLKINQKVKVKGVTTVTAWTLRKV